MIFLYPFHRIGIEFKGQEGKEKERLAKEFFHQSLHQKVKRISRYGEENDWLLISLTDFFLFLSLSLNNRQ